MVCQAFVPCSTKLVLVYFVLMAFEVNAYSFLSKPTLLGITYSRGGVFCLSHPNSLLTQNVCFVQIVLVIVLVLPPTVTV
jgi:hypothetical protein